MSVPIQAYKAKDGAPYSFQLGPNHVAVLRELAQNPGSTDADLTFRLGLHMAAPRRCELRDAGAVIQAGRKGNAKAWKLTAAGYRVLDRMTAVAA